MNPMQNHPNQDQSAGEENRRDSASPERRSKLEGFDTKKNRPGSTPRPGPGAVPPVDPVPDAGMAKPGGERKERKRFTQPLSEPERALAKDAAAQARQLKRKHRALYTTDPRRFRKIVRLAQSVVFRQKPGPKPDQKAARRIAHSARGTKWRQCATLCDDCAERPGVGTRSTWPTPRARRV